MASFAAILCGKEPKLVEFMIKSLSPNVEIVHACTSTDVAKVEIPALLRGEAITPESGYGTNVNANGSPRTDISLIIVGGGYGPAEFESIKAAADAAKPVPFVVADKGKNPGATGPPPPDVIKQRILAVVDEETKKDGGWAPGVYRF